jgi:TPR repeat protein
VFVALSNVRRYRRAEGSEAYARPTLWRERSAAHGEGWLRSAAERGDCFAMERLAERLLADRRRNDAPEALSWLRRAADAGSDSARHSLAVWILDEALGAPEQGWALLRQAARAGFLAASAELGVRLLSGVGIAPDIAEGERWLRAAATGGDRLAMILLGRYLATGLYLPLSPEGNEWLAHAGAPGAEVLRLGLQVYLRSLNGITPAIRRRLAQEAASLFLQGHIQGDITSSTNLGYLVRRGDVVSDAYPSLDELFSGGLAQGAPFAIVNEALRKAAGIQCASDWRAADRMFAELPGSSGVLEWWLARSQTGDPEGHLVLGWLARHGLTADPDGLAPRQRLLMARTDEWNLPEWMN